MLKRLKKIFGFYHIQNVLVTPYRSYGTHSHLYVLGRALDDVPLEIVKNQSLIQNIKNTYRQFDSFEIPNARLTLEIPDVIHLSTESDCEGYFLFDKSLNTDVAKHANEEGWVMVNLKYTGTEKWGDYESEKFFQGELLIPDMEAEYGIISDIDDTIMHTGVTSFLKWRLLKNSLLTNAYRRIPLKGAAELYKKLQLGKSGKNKNPVFYLSNSPWNLYQYLKLFLDFNKFPKGPMLLRNFRTPFDRSIKPEKPHKQKEIINILKTYPHLNFILIGDSGERDASIYTELAAQFSDRIMCIYLRSVRHRKRMERVQSIIDDFDTVPVIMVHSSKEAEEHARENGYII